MRRIKGRAGMNEGAKGGRVKEGEEGKKQGSK